MATKNMHKNVEAIIENIKNFDKQTNLNWDPIIKTKTYIYQVTINQLKYRLNTMNFKQEDI